MALTSMNSSAWGRLHLAGVRAYCGGEGAGQVPLLCWGVFRKTRRDANGDVEEDLGTVMEGLTAFRQPGGAPVREFSCAAESEDLGGAANVGDTKTKRFLRTLEPAAPCVEVLRGPSRGPAAGQGWQPAEQWIGLDLMGVGVAQGRRNDSQSATFRAARLDLLHCPTARCTIFCLWYETVMDAVGRPQVRCPHGGRHRFAPAAGPFSPARSTRRWHGLLRAG